MRDRNKSAYSYLKETAKSCAGVSGFVYPHGAREMEEGKTTTTAYPVCRFSISVFPGSLHSPAGISLLLIRPAVS